MAPEVKFTAWGIPYLVEFKNVAFRARQRSRSPPRVPTIARDSRCFSFILVDRPPSFDDTTSIASVETASSETLAYPGDDTGEGEGLFIQFATQRRGMHQKLSNTRLWRLKQRIAKAVLAAGMDASPGTEKTDPMDVPTLSRMSYGSIRSDDSSPMPDGSPGALFSGTYGQVMVALQARGSSRRRARSLGSTKVRSVGALVCRSEDLTCVAATRLGALFVANHTMDSKVEFTKLTLWA
ncbi:uncharacterized protein B0H18DRAFT_949984 [Fomitopsis serialis]|uniref:uncharacterized protein n=1 Tax=Fomitopsis serialis TaxID=139415 RepID=UPI0020075972|nr:uncharacterized protein B0H18DRAFT_949984 [Neoantrodia serialis]KAH9936971.1 hypothetical protein B0H18DRAFT_949984 [Neoantrodia serialis]